MITPKYTPLFLFFRYAIALCFGALLASILPYTNCSPATDQVEVAGATAESNTPNPIPQASSLFLQDLTWIDVRDRIRSGTKTAIIPTGGIEQNGPFVALNKHDLIVREVSARAAKQLGNALIAPVVSFVPEGEFVPPSGHLSYPGTLSVTENNFQGLLVDIGRSLAIHGFTTIALLGDSGDSQRGLQAAAERLQTVTGKKVSVKWMSSYYDYAELRAVLQARGLVKAPELFHEELAFTAQLAAIDPHSIRLAERLAAGHTTLNGFDLSDKKRLLALGEELLALRAEKLAAALR
jgi:creatinine amidohydrolase